MLGRALLTYAEEWLGDAQGAGLTVAASAVAAALGAVLEAVWA